MYGKSLQLQQHSNLHAHLSPETDSKTCTHKAYVLIGRPVSAADIVRGKHLH